MLCVVDHAKGFVNPLTCRCCETFCAAELLPLLVDLSELNWNRLAGSRTLFKANMAQIAAFSRTASCMRDPLQGRCDPNQVYDRASYQAILELARENLLRNGTAFRYLVVTFGAGGLGLIANDSGSHLCLNEQWRPVIDTVGAGDTVMAVLSASIVKFGYDWPALVEAVQCAVRAASLSVQHRGCYVVSAEEVFV